MRVVHDNKRLFVFCDASGDDGLITPDAPSNLQHPVHGVEDPKNTSNAGITNVLRLSRALKSQDTKTGMLQIVFYQSGVQPEANFLGEFVGDDAKLKDQGVAVAGKIRDVYAFLAQNYEEGDEILMFGFSRGAYILRKTLELIDKIGLLETVNLGVFFSIWGALHTGKIHPVPVGTRKPRIRCVGFWDTAGAAYNQIEALRIKDTDLPSNIDVALHAVSLQENRREFRPTLWTTPENGLGANQVLKEVWFPGSHSDVGGSYERHELADIALFWMVGEILDHDLFEVDTDIIIRSSQPDPEPWGASQPHNAYIESSWMARRVIHAGQRLESGDINPDINFHESWKFAPDTLTLDYKMVSTNIVQDAFTSDGSPKYCNLNAFEEDRKAHWNDRRTDKPIVFDDVHNLYGRPHEALRWIWSHSLPEARASTKVQGGIKADGTAIWIGRGYKNGGAYPGEIIGDASQVRFACNGEEETPSLHEILTGDITAVRWLRVDGEFALHKIAGFKPFLAGGDDSGELVYVVQAFYQDGIYCGNVKEGELAHIAYDGVQYEKQQYNVLAWKSDQRLRNVIGEYRTTKHWSEGKAGASHSTTISLSPKDAISPRIAVGLNCFDMHITHCFRIHGYTDNISEGQFTAHIATWADSIVYNGALSWLKLPACDPDIRTGVYHCSQESSDWVAFDWRYDSYPVVFVGMCGFDVGRVPRLSVIATNVSRTGFQINVEKWGDTELHSCWVTWIAFPANKDGICSGSFGSKTTTKSSNSGHIRFPCHFKRPPTIFTAFTKFDLDTRNNLRMRSDTSNATTSGMDWSIETWADSMFYDAQMAYLALED